MNEDELERLERDLDAVSGELAASRDWNAVSDGMKRQLRQPYWDVAVLIAASISLGIWAWIDGHRPIAALGLLLLLPGRLRAAQKRFQRTAINDGDLFVEVAKEIDKRFNQQLIQLVLGVPAVFTLLVIAFAVPNPMWPLITAAAVLLYMPILFRFRLRATSRELRESRRWRGESEKDEEDDDEEEDDDDESWLKITLDLTVSYFWVWSLYLGPPLILVMLGVALKRDDATRPLIAAGALTLLWIYTWFFKLSDDDEDDDDEDDDEEAAQ